MVIYIPASHPHPFDLPRALWKIFEIQEISTFNLFSEQIANK